MFNLQKNKAIVISSLIMGSLIIGATTPALANTPIERTSSISSATNHDVSGEDLFRGIFFVQGEVSESLLTSGVYGDPAAFDETIEKNAKPEAVSITNEIVSDISKNSPEFFENFKSAVKSEDPRKVKYALEQSQTLMANSPTFINLISNEDETYVPGQVGPTCFFNVLVGVVAIIAAGAVAVVTLAMGVNVAFAYNAAAAVNVTANRGTLSTNSNPALSNKFIADLTVALQE